MAWAHGAAMSRKRSLALVVVLAAIMAAAMFMPRKDDPAEIALQRCTAEALALVHFLQANAPDDPALPAAQAQFDALWRVANTASHREAREARTYRDFLAAAETDGATRAAAGQGDAFRNEISARLADCGASQ